MYIFNNLSHVVVVVVVVVAAVLGVVALILLLLLLVPPPGVLPLPRPAAASPPDKGIARSS